MPAELQSRLRIGQQDIREQMPSPLSDGIESRAVSLVTDVAQRPLRELIVMEQDEEEEEEDGWMAWINPIEVPFVLFH